MRAYNFSAGPAIMPEEVLQKAALELSDYKGTGMSVMEMSHRSKVYLEVFEDAVNRLRRVMNIPEGYKVLFLQGGATLQFASVPLNIISKTGKADYAVTGQFSDKAYKEAAKYGEITLSASSADKKFSYIPRQNELKLSPDASYFHYCMNNTVYGSVWDYIPDTGDVPIVCDMSSCILSQPMDISKFGIIYAGAQKNMGPSGLTVVIVREDLLGYANSLTPDVMNYQIMAKNDSMLNTPATYGVYLLGLILEWIEKLGGLEQMEKINREKAAILYDAVDASGFYTTKIEKAYRSIMNVTFHTPSPELDDKFVKEAAALNLLTLKGYRTAGGIRASIYNAMPVEGVRALAGFVSEFAKKNG